jgi:lipopolysaccharide assembly outer membrane protein LptD (OstA)
LFAVLTVLSASALFAQSKKKNDRLELLPGAGSLFHTQIRGEEVTWVIGSVHFRQAEGEFRADSARWQEKSERVMLVGRVKINYPDYNLSADSVRYDARSKEGFAYGRVRYEDLKEKTVLLGRRGRYRREKKYLLIDEKPEMWLLSGSQGGKPETTFVRSKKLEFFGDEEKGIAADSVRIKRGTVFAFSEQAVFWRKEEKLVLTESPRGGDDQSDVRAEILTLFFKNGEIERLLAQKKARATYREVSVTTADTTASELAADSIVFHFQKRAPVQIRALGQAYVNYFQADGSSRNFASGDSVELRLKERKVETVFVRGGGEGTYYAIPKDRKGEDTVGYRAEIIEYQIPQSRIFLLQKVEARYQNLDLAADSMQYDAQAELLYASGFADTAKNKTKRVLKDGTDEVAYDRLAYDFNTKKGKMKASKTKLEPGYYHGKDVSRVSDEVVFVRSGQFTTCDADTPHYAFASSHMKLITRNRVIAKPVVLKIADVPIGAIPFYIFPIKPGRHSGLLTFRIGNFGNQQRGVNNLGYYFALSDYYDLTTAADLTESGGNLNLLFRPSVNYNWRYHFSGSLSGSYTRDRTVVGLDSLGNLKKSGRDRWDFSFNHTQPLSPTAQLSARGNFVSDKNYFPDRSNDLSTRLNRELNPFVSLSKNLGWAGLTVVAQKTFNLDTDASRSIAPSISLSKPARALFSPGKDEPRRWYHSIIYGYGGSASNSFSRTPVDSVNNRERRLAAANHSLSLSSPQKLGWLTLSPNFNYNENWFHIYRSNASELAGVSPGNYRRGSGSVGVSSNTSLYGTFLFRLGAFTGLRHVLSPSVGYAYTPKSTRRQKEAQYAGIGVQTRTAQVVSFALSQLFQAKFSGEKGERKLDLFTVNSSAAYNFEAKSRRWSNLSTSVRSTAVPNFAFDFSARHDFYDQQGDFGWPRLLGFTLTSSFRFQRNFSFGPLPAAEGAAKSPSGTGEDRLPLSFSIGHSLTQTKVPAGIPTTQQINFNATLDLTRSWRVTYSQSYDITSRASGFQEVVLTKDLHCWSGYFSWRPSGFRKGYYFTLSVKALPELKISKEPIGLGTFLPSTFR